MARRITLRYAGTCVRCGISLTVGASALWNPVDKTVQCSECPGSEPGESYVPDESSVAVKRNAAGASARREYERRRSTRAEDVLRRHPRLGRVMLALSDDPQSTKAWARGATGEEQVARRLEKELGDRAVVLHDRRQGEGRANIDHLVVGPAGVFVVDTKRYAGRVEQRRVGPLFGREDRLYVGGRDRTNLVDGVRVQAELVGAVLSDHESVPVREALCFTGADWPMFSGPFSLSGVWIGWPRALTKSIVASTMLDRSTIDAVADRLDRAFRPA